eukprot:COSAG05_NODE_2560_length_2902_cov_2.007135_3_plen_264_part_00
MVSGSIMAGISSVSGSVLYMGILPSYDDGRAKNAGRDNNVLGFHSRIPNTILPLLIGHAMTWFHGHTQQAAHRKGFICFFWIGGVLGCVSFLMFVISVHPRYEELDVRPVCGTRCQCTRRWFVKESDLKRRERLRQEGKPTFMIDRLYLDLLADPQLGPPDDEDQEAEQVLVSTSAQRLNGSGPGARFCDRLLFGVDASAARLQQPLPGEGEQISYDTKTKRQTRAITVTGSHGGGAYTVGSDIQEPLIPTRKKSTEIFSNVQ